ncbi:MerR family transcriptional regulator [Alkalibacillus almallahensis]|uniref:MerR family transcriptional regulator n=1 Tax=Alkalibacillus almallahensis TaxID=1379154 RepID=UPI00141E6326|nr:MerR family transcriptional regulator [Alkalibacillus almallahensis]NIK12081.1 DNA-binding transcriptional MerR regulator [Alkalibacillus almallahensis]
MKDRFTIGEIAKLHNLSVKTLRYYDQIGLFKPAEIDPNNNYRYYSTEQFEHLNTINYLRSLGVPLKDIKKQFEERQLDDFLELLKRHQVEIAQKISELQQIHQRVDNRINEIDLAKQSNNIHQPFIRYYNDRHILQLNHDIQSQSDLELSLRKIENTSHLTSSIFIGSVGVTLPIERINQMKYNAYNSVFIAIDDEHITSELKSTLPAGKYVCLYCQDARIHSPSYYECLFEYIKKHQLTITGDAIERTIIDQFMTNNPEEYLSEIQIPIL